jgi:hypothetical protein
MPPHLPRTLVCVLLFWAAGAQALEFKLLRTVGNERNVLLSGEIVQGDYQRLRTVVLSSEVPMGSLYLAQSPGGDAIEAMKMGRLIRTLALTTGSNDTCNSACFLVWVAGVDRGALGGTLGLHRPYFARHYFAGLSRAQAETRYREMSNQVQKYLEEMDVPQKIIHLVFQTSSDKVYFIGPMEGDQNAYWSVEGTVPFFQEWIISKCGPSPTPPPNRSLDPMAVFSMAARQKAPPDLQQFYEQDDKHRMCESEVEHQARVEGFQKAKGVYVPSWERSHR